MSVFGQACAHVALELAFLAAADRAGDAEPCQPGDHGRGCQYRAGSSASSAAQGGDAFLSVSATGALSRGMTGRGLRG